MRPLVLVLALACGSRASPSPAPPPPPAPALAPTTPARSPTALDASQLAELATAGQRLVAGSQQLATATALDDAAAAITALHASARWRHAPRSDRDVVPGAGYPSPGLADPYQPLEPAVLATAATRVRALAVAYADAGRALAHAQTSGEVATAMQAAGAALDGALTAGLGTLSSELVDELVYDRDTVCAGARDAACTQVPAIAAAYAYARDTVGTAADAVRGAAAALERSFAGVPDVHLHVVLARVTGTGPAFGQPCGPEQLCAWNQACMAPTGTCEQSCFEAAMQPCPRGRRCTEVSELSATVCR